MSKYKLPKVEQLLEAGVHFGHQVRRWNPKMEPYIYSSRNNTHIIDLEQTEKGLKEAADFLYEVAKKGGQIILVGTKKQAREIITLEAKRAGALYVAERWLGGTLTNYKVIRKNADKLLSFLRRRDNGDLASYTKKERLLIDREIEKLEKYYGGIVTLRGMPQAVFVVDIKREKTAVSESLTAGVPIVGLVDTNSDPTGIGHVIPGNDDAIKSIAFIVKVIADAIEAGYKDFAENKASEAAQASAAKETSETVTSEVTQNVTYAQATRSVKSKDLVSPEVVSSDKTDSSSKASEVSKPEVSSKSEGKSEKPVKKVSKSKKS